MKSTLRAILVVYCLGSIGCGGDGDKGAAKKAAADASPAKETPDPKRMVRTAADLTEAYANHKLDAEKEYGGKEIVIEGKVIDLVKGIKQKGDPDDILGFGTHIVVLAGHATDWSVWCRMKKEGDFKTLKKGQSVRIVGEVGLLFVMNLQIERTHLAPRGD